MEVRLSAVSCQLSASVSGRPAEPLASDGTAASFLSRDTIFSVTKHTPTECDFLVVGAGVAGLRAAVELAGAGRVLHAQGDSTGQEILRALYAKAKTLKNISVLEFEMSSDLLLEDGRVVGVSVIGDGGQLQQITASAVLLATGGIGQIYRNTTNPEVATGDGVAMAYLAGAEISDMEFIQFHPTALYLKSAPRFLISEALRGEGAYLRNMEMDRFMHKYHALGELAPRDVVARALVHELEITRSPEPIAYLDLTHLKPDHVQHRFPRIYSTCMEYNIDITTEVIPI